MMQMFKEIGYDARSLRIFEQTLQIMPAVWVATIVMMTVFLVFLLYARQFFPTEERA
jgi:hypothetical protein